MEVGEVDRLPEPTEPPVTYPAADGQHPPHDHGCGHPVNPFVIAPGRHSKGEGVEYHVGIKRVLKRAGSCLQVLMQQSKTQRVSSGEHQTTRTGEVWLCRGGF